MVASTNAHQDPSFSPAAGGPAEQTLPNGAEAANAQAPSVFISYSRRDGDFVRTLQAALQQRGFKVWVDYTDIPPGADFPSEIECNIETNDAFLFVVSPDSVVSEWCNRELVYAEAHKKRILPVVCRDVEPGQVPPALGHLNWLFMRPSDDFTATFEQLAAAITTDLAWVKAHARLLVRAAEWERKGRDPSLLMRGSDLRDADNLLTQASVDKTKRPAPVQIQADYVQESERAAKRRGRLQLGIAIAVAVISLITAGFALFEQHNAIVERARALFEQHTAVVERTRAVAAEQHAVAMQRVNRARALAADAVSQSAIDPELGILLAMQAVRLTPPIPEAGDAAAQAKNALSEALSDSHVRAVLHGHGDWVFTVAFSADGRRLVTASRDETARVWDVASGREVLHLSGHSNSVNTATFDRTDRYIITASWDKTARLWDARTGRLLWVAHHNANVESAAFNRSGTQVVTASDDGTAGIWDVASGRRVTLLVDHLHPMRAVTAAAFSPDGKEVVTTSNDVTVRIWDAATGTLLRVLSSARTHLAWLAGAVYSPDGTLIATGGGDSTGRVGIGYVWDAATGRLVTELTGHSGSIYDVAFSPDSHRIVTASYDHSARIWDARTGQTLVQLLGHTDMVWTAAFSADGTRVVTASRDHTARVWDAATGQTITELRGHRDQVYDAVFSPGGARVATASADKTARVWSAGSPSLATWRSRAGSVFATYTDDGRYVLSVDAGANPRQWSATARLWGAHTRRLLHVFNQEAPIVSLSFDLLHQRVAIASSDGTPGNGTIDLWNLATGRKLLTLQQPGVDTVACSNDGTRIVAGSSDGSARIWDVHTRRAVSMVGHTGKILSAAFSRDDSRVVTTSDDYTVREWDGHTGKAWSPAPRVIDPVVISTGSPMYSATFSPDGKLLVTTAGDSVVQIWDASTGQSVGVLSGHTGAVNSANFSRNGKYLVTASDDGTARIWDIATERTLETFTGVTGQPLLYADFSPDGSRIVTAEQSEGTSAIYACDLCGSTQRLLDLAATRVSRTLTLREWQTYLPDVKPPTVLLRDLVDGVATGALPTSSPYAATYTYGYAQGEYVMRKIDPSWTAPVTVALPDTYTDSIFTVEARLQHGSANRGIDLACRQSPAGGTTTGYRVGLYPYDNTVFLARWDSGTQHMLVQKQPATGLRGGDEWNQVELRCSGDMISVRLNGSPTPIISVHDTHYHAGMIWMGTGINNDDGRQGTVEAHFRRIDVDQP